MGDGPTNHSFATELRLYERAFVPGTTQYAIRKDWPGEALRRHTCPQYDCVAYQGPISHDTYFICNECAALAPQAVANYRNAPYKVRPSPKKIQMGNVVCLATYFRRRRYGLV
jgi:hypothetical protein